MQNSDFERSHRLLERRVTKIRVALASGLVLAVGAWLAPRAAPTALSAPQEHAAPLLEEQLQMRDANRSFTGVQDVVARVRDYSVAIPVAVPPPVGARNDFAEANDESAAVAGFGVFVSDRHLLAHSAALEGRSSVPISLANDATVEARVVVYEPSSGLVLLQTDAPAGSPVPMTENAPAAGAIAVAVGHSESGDVAIPVFVTGSANGRYSVGAVEESVRWGMPIFTLDGELFAIAAPDGTRVRAYPARAAAGRLLARAITGERRSSFGLGVQALGGLLTRSFGAEGVVITEVMPGGPADLAGIEVGDVLLAVGEISADSVDTVLRALSSHEVGAPTRLQIRRRGVARTVDVSPILAYEAAARVRANADVPSGPEARAVLPAALLDASAIPATARVLGVNGRAVDSRIEVQRLLRTARTPVPVLLRHANETFFVVIEPAR